MITSKALQQILVGAQQSEDDGPCYCQAEDCEGDHEEPEMYPSHCVAFVTADGSLDKAANRHCLGKPWGIDGPLEYVLDHPQNFPDDADRMVVVDRETHEWRPVSDYL